MGKRLFVGGIPYSITDQHLKEMFSQFGDVESATVITDRFSGQSKGFAFVEMATDKEAQKAIDNLNETEVEGKKIVVNEARPREERPRGSYGYSGQRRDDKGGRSHRGGHRNSRSKRW